MAASSTTPGSAAAGGSDEASTTLGVGGPTSGQAGATPAHETQAETGGSGGTQLTHSHGEIAKVPEQAPDQKRNAPTQPQAGAEGDPADSALQTGARGALDTRAAQGGGTGTGLGSRESGANQAPEDLPPR